VNVRTIYLPRPLAHQKEVLDDPTRYKVCCWGRQCGKTAMGSIMCVWGHGPLINGVPKFRGAVWGASIWWVTKDFPTAEKIWRDLKGYLSRWGGDIRISESLMRIDFPGSGSISVKSAATSNRASGGLRGDTIHGLVLDEAAFCPQETWDLECQPMLMRHRGWVVFISTPDGPNWFEEIFQRGACGKFNDWKAWHFPSHRNPTLHPDELASIQATCDKYKWAREYLAEFNVQGGVVFERQWFKTYKKKEVDTGAHVLQEIFQAYDEDGKPFGEYVPRDGAYIFITADMAMTVKTASDYTAVMVWAASWDGRLWCLDLWRGKAEWPSIIPKIKSLYDLHVATTLVVEASGPLVRLNAEAKAIGMNVEEWNIHEGPLTEKRDKVSRNGPAAPHVQAGRVLFPNGAPWLNEFVSECCAFPMGAHDDMVDCLGMAVWHRPPNPPAPVQERIVPSSEREWGLGMYRGERRRSQWD
jgi:predicted phage terminase large subunit-like protein